MSIEEFFTKLQHHDWYYDYSDDHSVWTRGKNESRAIRNLCQENELFTRMYTDFADYMFKHESRSIVDEPKLEDYLQYGTICWVGFFPYCCVCSIISTWSSFLRNL